VSWRVAGFGSDRATMLWIDGSFLHCVLFVCRTNHSVDTAFTVWLLKLGGKYMTPAVTLTNSSFCYTL
jgi:hypothetical protein